MLNACAIILNYNDSETTGQFMSKLSKYNSIYKVVVVDNCSTDESYKCLKKNQSSKIDVIRTKRNLGYGGGNNFGVNYAFKHYNPTYIIIANPDIDVSDDVLDKCLLALEKNSELAIVSPIQLDKSGCIVKQYAWDVENPYQLLGQNALLLRHTFCPLRHSDVDMNSEIYYVGCVPGSLLVLKTQVFLEIGGYDEKMFLYYEESYIGKRLKDIGYKTAVLPLLTYRHIHAVSINKSIPSLIMQRKIQHESLVTFLQHEYMFSGMKLRFAEIFLGICLWEEKLLLAIKSK